MRAGLLPGIFAVAAFGLTLPFTRIAVLDSTPWIVFWLRLVIASGAAALVLLLLRVSLPKPQLRLRILAVCAGVVFGFPLFTSLAMNTEAAAHGGVVLGVLPLATAVCGVFINAERPTALFWLIAIAGSALVVTFSWVSGGGGITAGDGYLVLAILSASIGYAVGAQLSQLMPAWQVISWALAPVLPVGLIGILFIDTSSILAIVSPSDSTSIISGSSIVEAAGTSDSTKVVDSAGTADSTYVLDSAGAVDSACVVNSAGTDESTCIVDSAGSVDSTCVLDSAGAVESTCIVNSASAVDGASAVESTVAVDKNALAVWLGSLLYLGLISQYGGFLLWYRALAVDGVARASQLQLFQPFVTLAAAWLMLGEVLDLQTAGFAVLILLTIVLSRRARTSRIAVSTNQ